MVSMKVLLVLVVMAAVCHGAAAQSVTGYATCDDEMWLYADGHLLQYNSKWWEASPITLPLNTRVVAIMCRYTYGTVGGIKASFSNNVKTDGNWKCLAETAGRWNDPEYDDSNWPAASVVPNCGWGNQPTEIAGNADWIWSSSSPGKHKTVYCRKRFQGPADLTSIAQPSITGHATCNNVMWLYADGIELAFSKKWNETSSISMPEDTHVVGIKCQDVHGIAGIKAAFSNGVQTDGTWKCSTTPGGGWNKAGFDDRHWVHATVYPDVQQDPLELRGRAHWIWTTGNTGQDMTVYCRKEFSDVAPVPVVSYGKDCGADNPCRDLRYEDIQNRLVYFPHKSSQYWFVQCDDHSRLCHEKQCAPGYIWNQQSRFCVRQSFTP